MSAGEDDKVGYGRPPKATQFPKGKSGNPSGKARKSQTSSLADSVVRGLDQKITVVAQDGRKRRIRKGDALAEQIINTGLGKSISAAKLATDLERRAHESQKSVVDDSLSLVDEEIAADLIARIRASGEEA